MREGVRVLSTSMGTVPSFMVLSFLCLAVAQVCCVATVKDVGALLVLEAILR